MIFDDFKNINSYNINKQITDFILNLNPEIPCGKYDINENAYVNIEQYQTNSVLKLEAHKNHIDIQFLLKGAEKVFVCDKTDLIISENYDEKKDVIFYQTSNKKLNMVYLTPEKFLVLYPQDVHSPCFDYQENAGATVKKAVVKIKI